MYPKIKFKISAERDIETLKAFVSDASFDGGENLNWAIFRKYPQLKNFFKDYKISNNRALEFFIFEKYKKDADIIKKNLKIYQNNWQKVEKDFFELIADLFGSRIWPKGKYMTYPTIWGMYPRFLENKTFQIPHKRRNKKYVNVVIAHEMLHFMFYDYFYSKFTKYKKDKYNYFVWQVSEIFNEIIQNSPDWLAVFEVKSMGYPQHEKIVKKISKKYANKNYFDVHLLILDIIDEIEK